MPPKRRGWFEIPITQGSEPCSCLKLIWGIVSDKNKLLAWSIKESTMKGSWMWRKILKYRDIAKRFHKIELGSGASTLFWFDNWCHLGRLYDITGRRGTIDLGISKNATVAEVFENHRLRGHRVEYLNEMEDAIDKAKTRHTEGEDISHWKQSENVFKPRFVTRTTWKLMRNDQPKKPWYKGVWFKYGTPKYLFLSWIAIQNRLQTCDRMRAWNPNQQSECIICRRNNETRNHIFFECWYSTEVWSSITSQLLDVEFTTIWDRIVVLLTSSRNKCDLFLLHYDRLPPMAREKSTQAWDSS